jgi:hypothetical protein
MTNLDRPPRYHIYLLTIWQERSHGADSEVTWRFRLEDPDTGQRSGFTILEALMKALEQKINRSK